MNHGSLFSGIGGFDLAAEWMSWQNIFHCEINDFGKQVLKYYWPNATSYTDIKQTNFTIHRGTIDILTGGFPCQPYSQAGKRKGKDDERHKWPEMLRAIREVRPRWVVGENVSGLVNWSGGMVFHEVQTDLEAEGYEVAPFLLPACAKNAPHKRERIWFIAHANRKRNNRNNGTENSYNERQFPKSEEQSGNRWTGETERYGKSGVITNTNINGFNRSNTEHEKHPSEGIEQVREWNAANTCNKGLQRSEKFRSITGVRKNRNQQFAGLLSSNWQNFPTQSPLCSRNDGLSGELVGITFPKHRAESIKAYGNAIVPQVVFEIFKAIEQYENLNNAE